MTEVDYCEYCRLWDKGIIQMIQKHGHSGVVSWKIPYGCLDILLNRKEGAVGCMLRECELKLLEASNERG